MISVFVLQLRWMISWQIERREKRHIWDPKADAVCEATAHLHREEPAVAGKMEKKKTPNIANENKKKGSIWDLKWL